jgi:hypothetical protein
MPIIMVMMVVCSFRMEGQIGSKICHFDFLWLALVGDLGVWTGAWVGAAMGTGPWSRGMGTTGNWAPDHGDGCGAGSNTGTGGGLSKGTVSGRGTVGTEMSIFSLGTKNWVG